MRMRVSVVFIGVVLTIASVVSLDAQGKGKPGPQPIPVTSTIDNDVTGATVMSDGLPYTNGSGVVIQIYAGSGDWELDLSASSRIVSLTFMPAPGSGPGPTGEYNARLISRCFDSNGNITGLLAIGESAWNDRCSLRVGFSVAGKQHVLVMSPLYQGTGWATVSCAENDGDGVCAHWTITPGTGDNATIANLYEIGKAGREILKGSYYNTFAIDVVRAQ